MRTRGWAACATLSAMLWVGIADFALGRTSDRTEAPQEAGGSSGPYDEDYVIGVEDLLQIAVWKTPDLSLTVPVRPDGKISLPLIDDVQAAGLTPLQLKVLLKEKWKVYVSDPEVSVIVQEINSFKVFLVGEIVRPGELRLKDRTSLAQAISLAGGFTAFANPEDIVLLRRTGNTEVRHKVNFKKVVSGDRPEQNLTLRPSDTIFVP